MAAEVRLGFLGSGFIADHYVSGLRYVPGARVVANAATGGERGAAFAARHGIARTYDSMAALCADPEVDLVVVAAAEPPPPRGGPGRRRRAARACCARSRSGGTPPRRPRCSAWSATAGVFHGYLENEVFSPRS